MSKQFTVYSVADGTILRSGTCRDDDMQRQARGPGEAVIEGEGHDVLDRVIMPSNAKPYIRSRGASVAEDFAEAEAARRQLVEAQFEAIRAASPPNG